MLTEIDSEQMGSGWERILQNLRESDELKPNHWK
jgi:hypothetical protein